MPFKFSLICFLFFICSLAKSYGQETKLDSISDNLHNYGLTHNNSKLFIHFDKNVYTNNDKVWFTGYLLNSVTDLSLYNTLYLSLINNQDSTVVLQQKFLLSEGFCFGGLTLPDSLLSNDYSFVANTNIKVNGKPDGEFVQPVTIISTTVNPLIAALSIFKNYDEVTKNGTVLLKALSSNNRFVADAEIKYSIGRNNQIVQKGSAKSSVIGELMINYPADQINLENNLLSVSVKKGNQIRYINIDLPVLKVKKYKVQFYPEGGHLVNDLWCRVGFEIKDEEGSAIRARAILFENKTAKDTIETNSSGLGTFLIKPALNQKYTVKLLQEDTDNATYDLPERLANGIIIRIGSAVVDNELVAKIESSSKEKIHILVHNFDQVFLQSTLNLNGKNIQSVRFKLDSIPLGLQAITILDSLFRPVAERIFFAHYNQLNRMEIKADKEEYLVREKINLKLKIIGKDDALVSGLVSVACVQANRVTLRNQLNIVDYAYLQYPLGSLPVNAQIFKSIDIDYLDAVLLIKGWRKYFWPAERQNTPDLNTLVSTYDFKGAITKNKKPLKTPVELNIYSNKSISTLSTDSIGHFNIPYSNILSSDANKAWLNLNSKSYFQYEVNVNDPQDEIKKYVKSKTYYPVLNKTRVLNDENRIYIPGGIKLEEVVVKGKKDKERMEFERNGYANKCGDYVCMYNILNCENHRNNQSNRAPVKGKTYARSDGEGTVFYTGCTVQELAPNITLLKTINLPKEFYLSDISNKNEPIDFPTVYWNYQVDINNNTETPLSFNTGDLTGKFKIIIQGVTENGIVYGEKEIVIKNP
ncbi:hypothetical protein [Pedobacter nototheniae]|uniref:hypothetical protein n=1 Tax=Pedobacter nototheniae TaxID=2488994 RepID=UPI00292D56EE|nr:hypothetical protein [Pedobacter nototheniae]